MGEFDACWSTVIADTDTHDAFGEAPDSGWVQRCRLGSGHAGIHASDAGAPPRDGFRLWLQWTDGDDEHRLTELEPCPVTDGADLGCVFFAGHGGPHHCVPTSSTPRFGSHYRPDTAVSVNGSRGSGSVANPPSADGSGSAHRSSDPAPELVDAAAVTGRRARHADEDADEVAQWPAGHASGQVRAVDEVLLDLVDLLSELAAAIKAHREP